MNDILPTETAQSGTSVVPSVKPSNMWRNLLFLLVVSVGWIRPQLTSDYEVRMGGVVRQLSESTPNFTEIFCQAEEIRVKKVMVTLDLKPTQCALNLQALAAQHVGVEHLPNRLDQWLPKSLYNLSLTNNALTELCADVFTNLSVRMLNLSNNSIKKIAPESFDSMTNLQTLILDHNELSIFNFSFADCPKLKFLSLRYNFFKQLPQAALKQLRNNVLTILLSFNTIEEVHKAALDAKQYHEVRLDHNQLTSAQLLIKLVKAEIVDLSENRITCLPYEFMQNGLSRIKTLNLTGNPLECGCLQDLQRKMRKNLEFQKMSPLVLNTNILLPKDKKPDCA